MVTGSHRWDYRWGSGNIRTGTAPINTAGASSSAKVLGLVDLMGTGIIRMEEAGVHLPVMDAPYLFLPYQPEGTSGLARRLNPFIHYIACRWITERCRRKDYRAMWL